MKYMLHAALSGALTCAGIVPGQAEPIRIAIIDAFSGPTAQTTIPFVEGMRYAIAKINREGGFNGEPVSVAEYDNLNQPATAAEKLRAAIADGARVILQSGSSAIAAQISEDVRKFNLRNKGKEVVFLNEGSEAYELTAEKCQFWFFKGTSNPYVRVKALVGAMRETGRFGSKVYTFNQNYSYGVDHQKAQVANAKEAGSQVVGSVLHDVNKIQDFAPYVAAIKASGADTVLSGNWGNDIILLMRAIGDSGLKVAIGNTSLDTTGAVSTMGKAALGAYLVKLYNLEAGGKAGEAFAEDFKREVGHYPYSEEPTAVFGTLLLGEALKAVSKPGGKVDALEIALALENASYESPIGRWSVRKEDHQLLLPMTVSQVSTDARYKVDGTDMGFKLLQVVPSEEAKVPVDPECKMVRP